MVIEEMRYKANMERVTVVQFGGAIVEKILVEDLGSVLLVMTEEEWSASQVENRAPVSVGFKREYVVETATAYRDPKVDS
jgi:hypothetical protein